MHIRDLAMKASPAIVLACDNGYISWTSLQRLISLVAEEEREACARTCEWQWAIAGSVVSQEFANAVRERNG